MKIMENSNLINPVDNKTGNILPTPVYAPQTYTAQYNGVTYSYPAYPPGFAPNFYGYVAPLSGPSIMLQGGYPLNSFSPNSYPQPMYYPQPVYYAQQFGSQGAYQAPMMPVQPSAAPVPKTAATDNNWRKTSAEKLANSLQEAVQQPALLATPPGLPIPAKTSEKTAATDNNWRKTSAEKLANSPEVKNVYVPPHKKNVGSSMKVSQAAAATPVVKPASNPAGMTQAQLMPTSTKPQAPIAISVSGAENGGEKVSSSMPKAGTVKISFADTLKLSISAGSQTAAAGGTISTMMQGPGITPDAIRNLVRGGAAKATIKPERTGPMAKNPEASFENYMNKFVSDKGYGNGIPVRNEKKSDQVLHKPPKELLECLPKAKIEIGHSRRAPFPVQVLAPCRLKTKDIKTVSSVADKGILELGLENSGKPGHLFYNQADTPEKLKEYRRLKGKIQPKQPKTGKHCGPYTQVTPKTPLVEDAKHMHFYHKGRQWTLFKKNP